MEALLQAKEPQFIEFLQRARVHASDDVTYADFTRSLIQGDWSQEKFDVWRNRYAAQLAEMRHFTAAAAGSGGLPYVLAIKSAGAHASAWEPTARRLQVWVNNRAAEQVKAITDDQREGLKAVFDRYIVGRPISPNAMARTLRSIVGLDSRQQVRIAAVQASLEASGVPADKIAATVARETARAELRRAKTIARTEMSFAFSSAGNEAIKQAQESGALPTEGVRKQWHTAGDERVCPECGALDKMEVPFDADFHVGGKNIPHPPAHPNCRCTAITKLPSYAGYVRKPQPLVEDREPVALPQ